MKRLLILLLASDFSTDPRVYKQALLARDSGFDVTVCCYHNYDKYSDTVEDGCRIIRIPFANRLGLIPGIPTAILDKLTNKIIGKHQTERLDEVEPQLQPRTQAINTYLWASVLYGFAQVHFFFYAIRHKHDIVHATDLITLLTGALIKLIRRTKLVYDSHEMWIESMENYTDNLKRVVSVYEKILIRYADAVTTVNKPIAEELAKRYGIPTPTVVMNTPYLQPSFNHKPHDAISIIYQGRYARGRGIEIALEGTKNVDGVNVYMRGIDAYGKHEPYVAELKKINPDAEFIPPVDMKDMVKALDQYDIGIVPYIAINFNNENASPNKMFEYMMAGVAILASDLPVLKDVVENCCCGCTYKQDSPEDLARVLKEMIPRVAEMKKNARCAAESEYNWGVQGKKLIGVYETVMV